SRGRRPSCARVRSLVKSWASSLLGPSRGQSLVRAALALVLLGALFWALPIRRAGERGGHPAEQAGPEPAQRLDPFEKAGVTELKDGQRGPAFRLPLFTGGEA